ETPIAVAAPVAPPAFIGREQQLAALDDAFQAVVRGQATTVLLSGRPGVGKSALAQYFLDKLDRAGAALTLSGRWFWDESVPFKAIDSLVDALCTYLRGLGRAEADALLPRDALALAQVFPTLGRVEAVARAPVRANDKPEPREFRRRAFRALRELLARLG